MTARRGRDDGERGGPPEAIGPVLARVLAGTGLEARLAERRLLEAWPKVVGERVARHARPVDLADGVLTLEADNGVWRQELTLMLPLIERRYNEIYGEGSVRDVRWTRRQPRRGRADNGR